MALPTASDNAFPSILITEGTEPAAPAAGKQRVYIDSTTHHLKRTDSSGTDVDIETAASGAPSDAEYLVTASNGSLSAEKVVVAPATGGVVPAIVHKAADETVNASATLQNDDELKFTMAATGSYMAFANIYYSSAAAADIKFAFTVPAGAVIRLSHDAGRDASNAANFPDTVVTSSGTACGTHTGQGVGTTRFVQLIVYARTTGTGGDLQLQWAQSTSDATNTVVHLGSTLMVYKIA